MLPSTEEVCVCESPAGWALEGVALRVGTEHSGLFEPGCHCTQLRHRSFFLSALWEWVPKGETHRCGGSLPRDCLTLEYLTLLLSPLGCHDLEFRLSWMRTGCWPGFCDAPSPQDSSCKKSCSLLFSCVDGSDDLCVPYMVD